MNRRERRRQAKETKSAGRGGKAVNHGIRGEQLAGLGKIDDAIKAFRRAIAIDPDYADAHYNLGVLLRRQGRLMEAAESYLRATALQPDNVDAQYNLGNALQDIGRLEDAVASYGKALVLKPDFAKAHNNLGNALKGLGKLDEAVVCFHTALAAEANYADAHNNLGTTFQELGRLDEAVASCRKAIDIKPDFTEAHNNLGSALQDLGKQDEAVASFHQALSLKPDYAEAWINFMFAAKALLFLKAPEDGGDDFYKTGLGPGVRATTDFAMLEYYLESFKPHQADESVGKAMAALPPKGDEEIAVSGTGHAPANPPQLPDRVVALLHFGRSGTGLLHSLIDGHPEISTLPSIYLRGFFNAGVWKGISADGWRRLPERFADEFAVLFDANSPKPTPGNLNEDSSFLGQKEGMANVGEGRDEPLSLNRDAFCREALGLMEGLDRIDPRSFLLVVHAAFEAALATNTRKHTAFYHIHNPNNFAKLNLMRHVPDARLVMMVREPVQCCESWMRDGFKENDYKNIIFKIITMLFAIDQVAFRMQDSVGVRLEDLKNRPEETLRALCVWLGVEEDPSLYQMTAQGKKWWGDPSSPDYAADKAMSPFGASSTRRAVGAIFSEKDQLVLGTLFYPFSVRFAYRQPDPAGFEKALKEIRPLFDDMLDFEKVMAERSKIDPAQFKRRGAYTLLRAAFMDRWDVLNELKNYPHMLTPLNVVAE